MIESAASTQNGSHVGGGLLHPDRAPLTTGNLVTVYRDGASGLDAMLESIAGARERVHLETYILRADDTGHRFFRALEERARAGLEVALLYDDFGARGISRRIRSPLHAAGVRTAVFNPLRKRNGHRLRHRDHRKILVVDGAVGFTGGLNVADECYHGLRREPAPGPWRDLTLRVDGPAAWHLDAVFAESWRLATGHRKAPLPCRDPMPGASHEGGLAVLPDGPAGCDQRLLELIRAVLERTEREALFVSPYFLPGPQTLPWMGAAVERGARIRVLVAGANDHPVVAWSMRELLRPFLEAGVEIREYEGALMHAKAAVFDERWAVVGTSNLDQQSLHHSYEVNLLAEGGDLPGQLAQILREDLDGSAPMTLQTLARRPLLERARDRAVALVVGRL